jgi:hypothetical protein
MESAHAEREQLPEPLKLTLGERQQPRGGSAIEVDFR